MNKITSYSLFVLLFLSEISFSQDVKTEFIQKVEDSYQKMETLTSDFTQRKSLSFLEEDMLSYGKFYFVKPDIMKWDQTQPEKYYFILNDKEVIRYNGQKRQKIPAGSPQAMIFKEFILGTVDGSIFEDKRFESSYKKEKDNYRIELIPLDKNMSKRIKKIVLLFDVESLFLNSMLLMEPGGDRNDIGFSNQRLNESLNMDIFE